MGDGRDFLGYHGTVVGMRKASSQSMKRINVGAELGQSKGEGTPVRK